MVFQRPPRVLVTRSPRQASALADRLRELGAEPVLLPTIETIEPTSFTALDEALLHLAKFHWLLFTSANAVEALTSRVAAISQTAVNLTEARGQRQSADLGELLVAAPSKKLPVMRIAAIGPATAKALERAGLVPDLIAPTAIAESFTDALLPHARQPGGMATRFLLVRAEEAREHLPDTLRSAGAEVTIAPAYRTVIPRDAPERIHQLLSSNSIDAVTFTSSSTARNLFTLLETTGTTLTDRVIRASIGPITSAVLCELGFPPHVEAPQATVETLAEALSNYLAHR